ncbi:NAD(P)-binding domain-containing protein [Chloroflexi bacterium TSY]|nr:NAD(P)-binding domain-containing protein [Chloroflexi bacterium TSY]
MNKNDYPVAVIGAGPVGLAAAAHLVQRGEVPIVFEATPQVGGNIRTWAHVPMFSPWAFNIDKASVTLLEQNGWQSPPARELPTGGELVEQYLEPLAATPQLHSSIHLNARVTAITRRRIDKMKDAGRENTPFVLQVELDGKQQRFLAKAVIDASGTWASPNPIGSDGLPAIGEAENDDRIFYGIPDVLGQHTERYANKTVAVIGGGHSAINAILELCDLHKTHPRTSIIWILRKHQVDDAYGGEDNDALPGRGLLGVRIRKMVESGAIQVVTPFYLHTIEANGTGIHLIGGGLNGEMQINADEIIAATGVRPDFRLSSELRLSIDPSVESPPALAPLIDPNLHSCGTVPPHGEAELRHPEKDFYVVGMKSYGRAPTFLLATGYEQVRSVVAALAGDWEAAAEVQLNLPETGVCGVGVADQNELQGSTCCGTPSKIEPKVVIAEPVVAAPIVAETVVAETKQESVNGACCGTVSEVLEIAEAGDVGVAEAVREKLGGCCSG